MKETFSSSEAFQRLREKAEQLLEAGYGKKEGDPLHGEREKAGIEKYDLVQLIHDLKVYQVEMELQNEELRRAKAETEASREEYFDLYNTSPVAYVTLSEKGVIETANRAAFRLLGESEQFVGQAFPVFIYAGDMDVYDSFNKNLDIGREEGPVELWLRGREGPVRIRLQGVVQIDDQKRKHRRLALMDITDRIHLEQALKEKENRLRIALEAGRLGTWDWNLITGESVWDRPLYEILGRDPEGPAVNAETFFTYIHPGDIERVRRHIKETRQNGIDFADEFRVIREDGEVRWMASSARLYRDPDGRPVRMAGVNYDVTDKRQGVERLRSYKEELETRVQKRTEELEDRTRPLEEEIARRKKYEADLRASGEKILEEFRRRRFLSKKMVELIERERREIGRSLHDEVGQLLAAITMDLDSLKTTPEKSGAALKHRIEGIQERVRESVAHFRDISRRLRPDILEHLGLIPAIRSLVEPFEKNTDIQTHVFIRDVPIKMDPERELAIYRILQEATTNIHRYACAKNIFINLLRKDDVIRISVEDDGKGFEYDERPEGKSGSSKLGIVIMKERAAQLGGTLRIESQIGKGTQLFAEIPVDEEAGGY